MLGIPATERVACMTPTWRESEETPNALGETLQDFRDETTRICTDLRVDVIDGTLAIPHSLSDFPDGVHPNDRGHHTMGIYLARTLKALGWFPPPSPAASAAEQAQLARERTVVR